LIDSLIVVLNISMSQQSCRRADESQPFVCTTDAPQMTRQVLTLQPVQPEALEQQAFAAATPEFAFIRPGVSQYMPWVNVRKSVGLDGNSIIYVLRFRAQQVGAQIQSAPVYETVFISEGNLRMSEPLMLPGDRVATANSFKQTYFTLVPAFQFSGLIREE
jgi:hypothetical protein